MTCAVHAVTGRPVATAALKMRAPSRCTGRPLLGGQRGDVPRVLGRDDRAAHAVVGVLEADDAGRRQVRVAGGGPHGVGERVERERPIGRGRHGMVDEAAKDRGAAGLVVVDVRLVADDHLAPARAMRQQAGEVAHRPARHEDRRVLAHALRGAAFELVDRRVVPEHVVADVGRRHRRAHGGRGAGNGIRAEVDDPHALDHTITQCSLGTWQRSPAGLTAGAATTPH